MSLVTFGECRGVDTYNGVSAKIQLDSKRACGEKCRTVALFNFSF